MMLFSSTLLLRHLLLFFIILTSRKHFSVVVSKVIHHKFVVEYMTGSPDGVWTSNVLGINGQFPGPTVEGNVGDTVEIKVINKIQDGQNVSIHWHGIQQRGTQFQDGATQLTQCPLKQGSTQIYRFLLDSVGTFWYHSHVNSQYTEGLWGALIVHPADWNPSRYSFDEDILITLNDWYHTSREENEKWLSTRVTMGVPPYPSSVLMNGVGRFPCPVATEQGRLCSRGHQMRPVFEFPRYAVHRIRVVNTSGYATFNFTIDNHLLDVVEVDGVETERLITEAVIIGAGQRYSFLVNANGMEGSRYLIRATLRTELLFTLPNLNINPNLNATISQVTGVLQYVDYKAKCKQRLSACQFEMFDYTQDVPPMWRNWSNLQFLEELQLEPLDRIRAPNYFDQEINLNVSFINDEDGIRRATFNGVPLQLPQGVPYLVTMANDVGQLLINPNNDTIQYILRYNDVIQVVVNNLMLGDHPIHLHGHHFWVMGKGRAKDGIYDPTKHKLTNKLGHRRDTVMAAENSWVVIRFRADNVGIWSLHCHIDWHLVSGMGVLFVEAPELAYTLRIPQDIRRICKEHNKNM